MQCTRDERLLLPKTNGKVLLEFTGVVSVVPKSNRLVCLRHSQNDWSLQACVHLCDFTSMSSIADKRKIYCRDLLSFLDSSFFSLLFVLSFDLFHSAFFFIRIDDVVMFLQLH